LRRLVLFALLLIFLAASLFIIRQRMTVSNSPINHLGRTPYSAYKYNLCTEAIAFSHPAPDNPYKTDFTFQDPFRKAKDTIIPLLWDQNLSDQTVSFKVEVIVGQLDTFTESISHVAVLDGISSCCQINMANSSGPVYLSLLSVRFRVMKLWLYSISHAQNNGSG